MALKVAAAPAAEAAAAPARKPKREKREGAGHTPFFPPSEAGCDSWRTPLHSEAGGQLAVALLCVVAVPTAAVSALSIEISVSTSASVIIRIIITILVVAVRITAIPTGHSFI